MSAVKKVVVLDYGSGNLRSAERALSRVGADVTVTGDPQAALRWCEENRPDLLLLDYRMPVIDGLEFARRFRKPLLHRDVPIVLVTVVGDEPIRQAALDAGVTGRCEPVTAMVTVGFRKAQRFP